MAQEARIRKAELKAIIFRVSRRERGIGRRTVEFVLQAASTAEFSSVYFFSRKEYLESQA
jgi:hypothetical protein